MDNTKINLDQFKRAGVYLFLYKYFLPSIKQNLDQKQIKIDLKEWLNIICLSLIKNLDRC